MKRFIVLLRGINVSGKNKLPMKELREVLVSAGFQNVATYIQSGNIVLDSKDDSKEIETRISQLFKGKYGYDVPAFAYTVQDWEVIMKECPYEEIEKKVYYTLLDREPKIKEIEVNKTETDEFSIRNNMVYLYCLSYGKTKLSNNLFENKLKVTATTRNRRTVMKLFDMVTNP
jgi:uncharacterized protein (DUF1697 family)